MSASPRFEAILDPMDLWCIWDNRADTAADFAGMPLVGLTEDEAKAAIELLTILDERLSPPSS